MVCAGIEGKDYEELKDKFRCEDCFVDANDKSEDEKTIKMVLLRLEHLESALHKEEKRSKALEKRVESLEGECKMLKSKSLQTPG